MDSIDLNLLAKHLAKFLKELQEISTVGGFPPGPHNFYRGDSPVVYDGETRDAIFKLQDYIYAEGGISVWEKAISSKWDKNPVWIHGDFSIGNILIKDGVLGAVIDFGGMAFGDPACDLVIAWTFLTVESRKIFRENLDLDSDTWARARGWALWKALITLVPLEDKTGLEAMKQKKIIDEIIKEHEFEKGC